MATIYMKIEGIDGKVTAEGHEKWTEIGSFSTGVGRAINSSNPGNQSNREASVPSFSEITVTKDADETSPKLFAEACNGKAKKVEFHFCNIGDKVQSFLEYVLSDVLISGYSLGASSGGGQPSESISFNFSKIEMKYIPYNDKNEPGTPIPVSYDLVTAKKT